MANITQGFPHLDIQQILHDAQHRWLRPTEVLEILRNYQRFPITRDPPNKPAAGSLFLFDRRTLRYFRKDGHNWRKKKDGKTVREAHERLKAGSVDVLHCYYARGEENENFQRRCYWMLDVQYDNIVLVHYREVKEGGRSGYRSPNNNKSGDSESIIGQQNSIDSSAHADSQSLQTQSMHIASPSSGEWNKMTPTSDSEECDSVNDIGVSALAEPESCYQEKDSCYSFNETKSLTSDTQRKIPAAYTQSFTDLLSKGETIHAAGAQYLLSSTQNSIFPRTCAQKNVENKCNADFMKIHAGGYAVEESPCLPHQQGYNEYIRNGRNSEDPCTFYESCDLNIKIKGPYAITDSGNSLPHSKGHRTQMMVSDRMNFLKADFMESSSVCGLDVRTNYNKSPNQMEQLQVECNKSFPELNNVVDQQKIWNHLLNFSQITPSPQLDVTADLHISQDDVAIVSGSEGTPGLNKSDSFGLWMAKEIGGTEDNSLVASDSGTYWNTLDNQNGLEEVSSLSRQMQLDIDSMAPSIAQEQLFSITDYSPEWAYSNITTKVLITGSFLKNPIEMQNYKWSCMFGEIEVPAELLGLNVIRCHAPPHASGRVPFYITCSNRSACSEVREFEYLVDRDVHAGSKLEDSSIIMSLQIRFARLLSLQMDEKDMCCMITNCEKCTLKKKISFLRSDSEYDLKEMESSLKDRKMLLENPQEKLLEQLLKQKLYDWLIRKVHEEGKGPSTFDNQGQGVIHLAAALGYEWAIFPIVASGVSVNFRDIHGWTALHWAAYYGREDAVVTLVEELGAAAGAVTDPTTKFRSGQTPADLAYSMQHKGIAGYLAEKQLTSHLSSLSIKENILDNVDASLAGDKAVESVSEGRAIRESESDAQLCMRDSLNAVRNSAQAVARIQAVFRIKSFRMKQQSIVENADNEVENNAAIFSASKHRNHKPVYYDEASYMAALRIQRKYRGWRGRKEFLLIRKRIVKIQAHIRGHNVRKQYRQVIWSVGIVEKAILRWRRKRVGLRGFKAEETAGNAAVSDGKKVDEYEYLREGRKKTVASLEKALARVQSMVRHPEARDQYHRLVVNSQKIKDTREIDDSNSTNQESCGREKDVVMSVMD